MQGRLRYKEPDGGTRRSDEHESKHYMASRIIYFDENASLAGALPSASILHRFNASSPPHFLP
jgi:hypothetical protein